MVHGARLESVWVKARRGSNPLPSAFSLLEYCGKYFMIIVNYYHFCISLDNHEKKIESGSVEC